MSDKKRETAAGESLRRDAHMAQLKGDEKLASTLKAMAATVDDCEVPDVDYHARVVAWAALVVAAIALWRAL